MTKAKSGKGKGKGAKAKSGKRKGKSTKANTSPPPRILSRRRRTKNFNNNNRIDFSKVNNFDNSISNGVECSDASSAGDDLSKDSNYKVDTRESRQVNRKENKKRRMNQKKQQTRKKQKRRCRNFKMKGDFQSLFKLSPTHGPKVEYNKCNMSNCQLTSNHRGDVLYNTPASNQKNVYEDTNFRRELNASNGWSYATILFHEKKIKEHELKIIRRKLMDTETEKQHALRCLIQSFNSADYFNRKAFECIFPSPNE